MMFVSLMMIFVGLNCGLSELVNWAERRGDTSLFGQEDILQRSRRNGETIARAAIRGAGTLAKSGSRNFSGAASPLRQAAVRNIEQSGGQGVSTMAREAETAGRNVARVGDELYFEKTSIMERALDSVAQTRQHKQLVESLKKNANDAARNAERDVLRTKNKLSDANAEIADLKYSLDEQRERQTGKVIKALAAGGLAGTIGTNLFNGKKKDDTEQVPASNAAVDGQKQVLGKDE